MSDLVDMKKRIDATRFPEKETVADFSQGVPLATIKKLAQYWATRYEARHPLHPRPVEASERALVAEPAEVALGEPALEAPRREPERAGRVRERVRAV